MKRFIQGLLIAVLLAGVLSPATHPTYSQTPETTEPALPNTQPPEPQPGDADTLPGASILEAEDTTHIYLPMTVSPTQPGGWTPGPGWPMVGANPARTSWSADTATGNLRVVWYRPIEAYISQNVQIIASDGVILVATARGLYALHPANGSTVWRYDTALPVGNAPTVVNGVVYFGGYDRKIHALDVRNGVQLWEYAGAGAGFDTNPLVVDGRVFAGNRDGYMYAIGAHGTARQGQLLWRYRSGGPIHLSAAYKDGIVFFAADDNHAYALDASNGALRWKSQKMPGEGYHSYWPVIYQDKVIFSASHSYRFSQDPGSFSVIGPDGNGYTNFNWMQTNALFPNDPNGAVVGANLPAQSWSHGYPIIDVSRITELYENRPDNDPYKHKPWRRTTVVLNIQNGSEYTFDSDGDGYAEYAPIAYWGTSSGNRFPPLVGPDGILYSNNIHQNLRDARGSVMGWNFGTKYMSVLNMWGALAEPQALSGGGNMLYRSICCDRSLSATSIASASNRGADIWSWDLHIRAPGYDDMWTVTPEVGYRLHGNYKGNSNSVNGIYHNHGDQNPAIPYGGMLFSHRSNAIVAVGTGSQVGKLPMLEIRPGASDPQPPSVAELQARLEEQVLKIVDAGHLRPGYLNNGTFNWPELNTYFSNPGDTLLALSQAYPYLSPALQQRTRTYLQQEFQTYFVGGMYTNIGWAEGAPRESTLIPPEVQANFGKFPKNRGSDGWSWSYPQHNFYAMWKYAALVAPDQAGTVYDLAKSKLQVPLPSQATTEYLRPRPFELNAYIAGYIGFLRLQEVAGRTGTDDALRTQVNNELNRLYQLRVSIFSKDSPYSEDFNYHKRSLNVARNFIFMTPELGSYIRQTDLNRWQVAINEYDYVAPYWFVSRYEAMMNETTMANLYNPIAMFQAKAYIQGLPRNELTKYLDAPAFERGDLFYIQNLVTAIQAP